MYSLRLTFCIQKSNGYIMPFLLTITRTSHGFECEGTKLFYSYNFQYYDDGSRINEPLFFPFRTSLRTSLAQVVEPNTSPGLFSPSLPPQRPITNPLSSFLFVFTSFTFQLNNNDSSALDTVGCQLVRQQIQRSGESNNSVRVLGVQITVYEVT